MQVFKDEKGREWNLEVNICTVKLVRDLLKINLLELEVGSPPLLTRLGTELMLLVDVIFVMLKEQADAVGVSDEEFGRGLNGPSILSAQTAFFDELVLFFRGLGRTDVATAVKTQGELIAKAIQVVDDRIQNIDTTSLLQEAFGKPSTKSPESSESTPVV